MKLLVFLVEDDATIRAQLIAIMTGLLDASIVGTAESEPEATRWLTLNQGAWNLAVIDLFLEKGTGFSVMSNMRCPSAQEHVVVLSNSATAENRQRAFECGAKAVFDKTQEIEEFFSYCQKLENFK